MNNLLVMKFGGTSMGSAERIRVAAAICTEQKAKRPVLAVVSAMSGVTDLLLGALRHAEADDEAGIESSIHSLSERHEKTCHELLSEPARCDRALAGVRELIADFRRIAHGMLMLGDRPPRSVDEAIAIGERLSALMIAEYMEASGIPARTRLMRLASSSPMAFSVMLHPSWKLPGKRPAQ
jgi:aspartokinase/homoserine dehydrogenase 1